MGHHIWYQSLKILNRPGDAAQGKGPGFNLQYCKNSALTRCWPCALSLPVVPSPPSLTVPPALHTLSSQPCLCHPGGPRVLSPCTPPCKPLRSYLPFVPQMPLVPSHSSHMLLHIPSCSTLSLQGLHTHYHFNHWAPCNSPHWTLAHAYMDSCPTKSSVLVLWPLLHWLLVPLHTHTAPSPHHPGPLHDCVMCLCPLRTQTLAAHTLPMPSGATMPSSHPFLPQSRCTLQEPSKDCTHPHVPWAPLHALVIWATCGCIIFAPRKSAHRGSSAPSPSLSYICSQVHNLPSCHSSRHPLPLLSLLIPTVPRSSSTQVCPHGPGTLVGQHSSDTTWHVLGMKCSLITQHLI